MPNEKISKLYAALTKPRDEFNGSPLVSTEKLGNNIAEFESKLQNSEFKDKLFKVITKPRDEFGGSPFLSEAKVGKSIVEFDSLFSLSQKKNPIGSESTSGFAPSPPIKQGTSPLINKNETPSWAIEGTPIAKTKPSTSKSLYISAKPGLLRLEQAQQQLSQLDKEIKNMPQAISFDQLSKGEVSSEQPISYTDISGFNQSPQKQVSAKDLNLLQKSRVENIKKERDQLYSNVKANIKQTQPQIQKIVDDAINTNGLNYFTKTVDGDKSPSESTISDWTSKNIGKLGLTDESYVNDLIKREISSNVSYKLIEPKINKEFTDNFKKEFKETPDQAVREDFEKGFGALTKIKVEKDLKIKSIENDIKTQAKDEISAFSNEYKTKFNDFNNNYKTSVTALQTQAEQLNESYKTGKLDEQNYKLQFDQLKQQEGALNKEYETGFKTVADEFLRNQNAINARFDQRYRRQVDEVNKIATDKLQAAGKEYSKTYKMSPELKARYEKVYKKSVDNVTKREELAAYTRERIEGAAATLGKSLASGFGTGIKDLAGFVDWDLGQTWGKDLESAFSLSNADINKPSDLLDVIKLARSTGQTVGAMAPMLAGNALIAMSTGGMSIPAQLAIQGGFGYMMETAQMASGAYDRKLEQSGIVADAEKAANTVIKGNTLLLPLYALDGLPFIEGATLGIKNRLLRGVAKGGIETVTEITQEVPQTAIEDLAQAGKGLDGLLSKLNLGDANNRAEIGHTVMNVIPTSLVMGSSPTFLGYAKKPYNFVLGMTTSAKNTIKDIEGSAAKKQFIFDTFATKGESFTKGMLHSMYASGLVNETELSEMKSILDTSKDLQEKSDKLKLTKKESKIYSALSFNLNNAKAEFESMTEGIEKDALGKKVKELESNLTNFINNKQANYAVITLPNKEQYVYTINGVLDYIKNNPALIKAIKENKLNLTVVSNKNDQFAQELDAIISPANEEAKNNPIEVDLATEAEMEDGIPSMEELRTSLVQEFPKQGITEINLDIEAAEKRIEIEKRRKEELNEYKDKDASKVEDFTFTNKDGEITYIQIRTYPNGKRMSYQGTEKNKFGNVNDNSPFEISKEQVTEDYLKIAYPENTFGKYSKTGEKTGEEASLNTYSRKINEKYDAELAALETTKPTEKAPVAKVTKPISAMKGESVTVNIGGKAITGRVYVDEGGKSTIETGGKIYELNDNTPYVEYASPIRLADNGLGIEFNGVVYQDVSFETFNGVERAILVDENNNVKTVTDPALLQEIAYQSALNNENILTEEETLKLIEENDTRNQTEVPTATEESSSGLLEKTQEELKLQEALDEIDLIEQIALEEINQAENAAKLVEVPVGKDTKVYLVSKNQDGSYSATLDGKAIRRGDFLVKLGILFDEQTKQQSNALIEKLQDQIDQHKADLEEKLFNIPKVTEDATKISTEPVTEVGEQGDIVQREGTKERQPEAGKRKRSPRETKKPKADNRNRPVSSEKKQEVKEEQKVEETKPVVLAGLTENEKKYKEDPNSLTKDELKDVLKTKQDRLKKANLALEKNAALEKSELTAEEIRAKKNGIAVLEKVEEDLIKRINSGVVQKSATKAEFEAAKKEAEESFTNPKSPKFKLNLDPIVVEEGLADEVARIIDEAYSDPNFSTSETINIDDIDGMGVPTEKIIVDIKNDKRPEALIMSKLRIGLNFIYDKSVGLGMSDTLTTGSRIVPVMNIKTGQIEDQEVRDEGGIGYPFKSLLDLLNGIETNVNKIMAWAGVSKGAAGGMMNAAEKADKITGAELKAMYFKSLGLDGESLTKEKQLQKDRLEKAIPDNKQYGLVTIYKMGSFYVFLYFYL